MLIDTLIRTAIGEALTANVTVNAVIIPVYHKVPDDAVMPYIEIIGQSTAKDKPNKDGKGFQSIVPIRVLTRQIGGGGGDGVSDQIEQQVIDLIDEVLEVDGYSIIDSDYQSQTFNKEFGKEYQSHKIINFSFTIRQN
jgi:hypothetical protein